MGMLPELEDIYPEGSNITIMNTYYNYPIYDGLHKVSDDFIILVYKDNNTGKKNFKMIKSPSYTFYQIKPEYKVPNYNQLFIPRDQVKPVTVPFHKLEATIAKLTDNEDFYKENLRNRNKMANRKLHTEPSIFLSDVNIEDHYRFKFANTYTNDIRKLNKGFFDIEVDGKWAKGDFVRMGECAINCVSFYNESNTSAYTFILRDERNPMIQDLEDRINNGKFGRNDIHDFVVNAVGGQEKAEKFGLADTKYYIQFYDEEIDMIEDIFTTMHECSPDFIEGWNSSAFDLEYIIARIEALGYNPADIMSDKRFPVKIVKNFVDSRHQNELAERGDYTYIAGLPVFIDQMIQYASRRKAKIGSYKSFKLDDIGLKEAKVQKLDYHHITDSVVELPWLDFQTFVLYNIMDVIVQKCIESKTNDLEYIFSKCVVNNTVYRKGHRQTIYLINRMAADWYKMGYIMGNNCNKDNPKPPKYLGALVGNPINTSDFSKMSINDIIIWVCENLVDYDFKSLYPSIMNEDNIAPNTQIGRIEIDEKVYSNENAYHIEADKYSRGGEFVENMVTDNMIEFSHRWFHLANIEEFLHDMDEYYYGLGFGNYSRLHSIYNDQGVYAPSPIVPTSKKPRCPVSFNHPPVPSPVTFFNKRDSKYNYDDLLLEKEKK